MELKLDVSCHLPKVYPKFQIEVRKHVEKPNGRTDIARECYDRFSDGGITIAFLKSHPDLPGTTELK